MANYEKRVGNKCKHCHKRVQAINKGRGLCYRCHGDDRIKIQYAIDPKYVTVGHGLRVATDTVGWEPTDALPGTEEKIEVMEKRAALGVPLWHPLDAVKDEELRDKITPMESLFIGCTENTL